MNPEMLVDLEKDGRRSLPRTYGLTDRVLRCVSPVSCVTVAFGGQHKRHDLALPTGCQSTGDVCVNRFTAH